MPKVSVIVPNYNHDKFLRNRLDSIVHQTFKDFELIILDDNSSDDSSSIIKEYQTTYPNLISFFPSTENSGSPFKQWDKGISLAKGELIWIAESDDLGSVEFLANLVPVMEKNQDVALICSKSNAIDGSGNEISNIHPIFKGFEDELFPKNSSKENYYKGIEFLQKILVNRCLIPNVSAVLLRKSAYLKVGGLDTDFKRSGDYNLYFKICEFYDVIFYNQLLNSTRYHDNKLTAKNSILSFHERYIILKRIFRKYRILEKTKIKSGNFYFTVYTYDIFLNKAINSTDKIKCFLELAKLYPHLFKKFGQLLISRSKINFFKKING